MICVKCGEKKKVPQVGLEMEGRTETYQRKEVEHAQEVLS